MAPGLVRRFASLASLVYDQVFHLSVRERGLAAAAAEPWSLIGLIIGARIATRLMAQGPDRILRFLSHTAWVVSAALLVFAAAPNVWVAIAAHSVITATLAVLAPGIVLPVIGWLGDQVGLRWGMLVMVPIFLIGGVLISTSKDTIARDIAEVWSATAARSEVAYDRRHGAAPLLVARGVEVGYDGVQVLFGVKLSAYDAVGADGKPGVTAYLEAVESLGTGERLIAQKDRTERFSSYIGLEKDVDPTGGADHAGGDW